MPAYIISNVEVFNADAYGEYGALAVPAIEKYGGRFLARGGAAGSLGGRLVRAPGWWWSSFPPPIRPRRSTTRRSTKRPKASGRARPDFNMMVVDGL